MASLQQDGAAVIASILKVLNIPKVIAVGDSSGDVTPAAVRFLLYAYQFLYVDGDTVRTPQAVSDLVQPASFRDDLESASPATLSQEIFDLVKYATSITISNRPVKSWNANVFGLSHAMDAVAYALNHKAFKQFMTTLNWTVLSKADHSVALNIGPVTVIRAGDGLRSYLLEGLMAAGTAYPELSYQGGLDQVMLMPTYDSELQIEPADVHVPRKYRILLSAKRFTDHYLEDIMVENRNRGSKANLPIISMPLSQGYLYFNSPEFLQGMLQLTRTVGLDTPWLALETKLGDAWIAASAI